MANGYFERGEVYWIKISDFGGNEVGGTRPGLIVSTNDVNKTGQVAIAYLTTSNKDAWAYSVPTMATGRHSYVKCDCVVTVQTNRLSGLAGVLNAAEQKAVDDALEKVFDLGYVDDTAIKEKESEIADLNLLVSEARAETAGVKAEISKRDEEIAALKMEIEMWQKCYGRCMDMLVDVKVNADVQRRTAVKEPEPKVESVIEEPKPQVEEPKQPEPPVEEPKDDRLDINSCTATALKKIGFSLAMARKIVESRPFSSVGDLKRVNGLKATQFRVMEPKLRCVAVKEEPIITSKVEQPEVKKVNVNTAKAREIHEVSGIALSTCYCITKYRKDNGPYEKLTDLLNAKQFGPVTLERFGKFLEV